MEEENLLQEEISPVETGGEEKEEKFGWQELLDTLYPNLESNAVRIELTSEEYRDLLREFIDESRDLRSDLLDEDPQRRHQTIVSLKDASTLLQLNPLPEFLTLLEKSDASQRPMMTDAFYEAIARLKNQIKVPKKEKAEEKPSAGEKPIPEMPTSPEMTGAPAETELPETVPSIPESAETETFLRDVKTVPIEFSLKIAAEELNLPEDLVLEFINDFAAQGHEYLPVLIEAFKNGDLNKLQETAHMLKGAASNLRIEPMVENLYELQFDNDIERAPKRIKLFAGQLMSLDNYLSQMNEQ